ncbi:MAG: hypothetical protein JAY90_05885 [Candidatus Thiodiazotropha lotti]|nr:hypothetical protein [Candidatus Thiodiazotropha lotti]
MSPLGGDFSLSGLHIVEKMVANYNTAFPQYQRFGGTEPPFGFTLSTKSFGYPAD